MTRAWSMACAVLLGCGAAAGQENDNLDVRGQDLGQMLAGASPQSVANMLLPTLGQSMGMPPRHSVIVYEEERSSLRAMLLALMRRQYPGDTLDQMNAAYQHIGLVPAGVNLREEALRLYEGQVAGFYDPHSAKLALVRGNSMAQWMQVLQHELAHALQDQYFSLQTLINGVMHDEDQALALQAAIEGQAVVAMFGGGGGGEGAPRTRDQARVMLREAGMEMSEEELDSLVGGGASAQGTGTFSLAQLMIPDKLPVKGISYLQAQLLFPYQEGTRFIEHVMEQQSFAETITRTLGHPPRSTRQVLHPQVYAADLQPVAMALAHCEQLGSVVYETTVGELNIRTLFGGSGSGDAPAAGWVGDHLALVKAGGATPVVWLSAWQSVGEAAEFARALRRVFAARAESSSDETFIRRAYTDVIVREGERVGVLAGLPRGQQDANWRACLLQDLRDSVK